MRYRTSCQKHQKTCKQKKHIQSCFVKGEPKKSKSCFLKLSKRCSFKLSTKRDMLMANISKGQVTKEAFLTRLVFRALPIAFLLRVFFLWRNYIQTWFCQFLSIFLDIRMLNMKKKLPDLQDSHCACFVVLMDFSPFRKIWNSKTTVMTYPPQKLTASLVLQIGRNWPQKGSFPPFFRGKDVSCRESYFTTVDGSEIRLTSCGW